MRNQNSDPPLADAQVITRDEFLADRHGKTFSDVVADETMPFDVVLEFFNDAARQHRMEDSEIHHDRAPLAGVVRELEALPAVRDFFGKRRRRRSARLRQAIGVLVRMIMERRGWKTTGKKGSLGVRGSPGERSPYHNAGGLAMWFIRAERYRRETGMPFRTVRERCAELEGAAAAGSEATEATNKDSEAEDPAHSSRAGEDTR